MKVILAIAYLACMLIPSAADARPWWRTRSYAYGVDVVVAPALVQVQWQVIAPQRVVQVQVEPTPQGQVQVEQEQPTQVVPTRVIYERVYVPRRYRSVWIVR